MTIRLTSKAFENNGVMPAKYTAEGQNISPPLRWEGVRSYAQSVAIICEDMDSDPQEFTHWLIYDIDPKPGKLDEALETDETLEDGTRQGINDFGGTGYQGPEMGCQGHRYRFRIFALDRFVDLVCIADKDALLEAIKWHILDKGELIVRYGEK